MAMMVKKRFLSLCLATSIMALTGLSFAGIQVIEEGLSDAVDNGEQRDYLEAVMDAKLKAIEKAGVSIKALTVVENFELKQDLIESKAEAILLPGFVIKKIGYDAKRVYHVVLVGEIQSAQEETRSGLILTFGAMVSLDAETRKKNPDLDKKEEEKDFRRFIRGAGSLTIDGKLLPLSELSEDADVYVIKGIKPGKRILRVHLADEWFPVEKDKNFSFVDGEFEVRLGKDRYCLYRLSFEAKYKDEFLTVKSFLEPHTGISAQCYIMNQGQPSRVRQCEQLDKHLEALDDCSLIYKEVSLQRSQKGLE